MNASVHPRWMARAPFLPLPLLTRSPSPRADPRGRAQRRSLIRIARVVDPRRGDVPRDAGYARSPGQRKDPRRHPPARHQDDDKHRRVTCRRGCRELPHPGIFVPDGLDAVTHGIDGKEQRDEQSQRGRGDQRLVDQRKGDEQADQRARRGLAACLTRGTPQAVQHFNRCRTREEPPDARAGRLGADQWRDQRENREAGRDRRQHPFAYFASGRWPEFSMTTRMFLALASSVVCEV